MKEKLKELTWDVIADILGSFMFGIGIVTFTEHANFAPGGVSGIALMVKYLWDLPIGTTMLVLNIPLMILSYFYLGKSYTYKTLKTVVINTLIIDGIVTPLIPMYTGDRMIAAIFGGLCLGIGMGVIFYRGSTTGGTDILGFVIGKKFPHIPIGKALLSVDILILLSSIFVFEDFEAALYGIIFLFFSSYAIDTIIYGRDKGKLVMIMSKKSEEIAREVLEIMDRGCTFLDSQGAYEREQSYVLMCAVRNHEYHTLQKIVHKVDPRAFMVISEASEILGEGFKEVNEKNSGGTK